MSITSWLFQRERVPNITKIPGSCFDKTIDNFGCYGQDEYHTEGEMGMAVPPFTAKFSKGLLHGHLLGVADEDGNVQLIDSRKPKASSVIKGWSAHSNAVFDIAWVGEEAKMLTASGDQTARLWDIEKAETLGIFRGHTCSLKSINVQCNSAFVFATGARDGKIMIWDTRCHMKNGYYGPMNTIHGAHVRIDKNALHVNSRKRKPRRPSMLSTDSKQSVTAVVFQDENIIISSGACDGSIKMWDIRRSFSCYKDSPIAYHMIPYPDQSASRKHGYSSLILDSTSSRLFATCINDVIYMYQSSNLPTEPVASFYGHQSSTFYIKSALSPDDRFLLSGSGDDNCYVFKVDEPCEAPWVLKGHVGEVTSVSWCPTDITKLVTCSDDNSFRIWRSTPETHGSKQSNPKIGSCSRKETTKASTANSFRRICPTNKKSALAFRDCNTLSLTDQAQRCGFAVSPSGSTFDDALSCSSISSIASPVLRTPKQGFDFATPTPRFGSTQPTTPTLTPKNSRLILEEWLKTTPSPSSAESCSPADRDRGVLSEQNGNRAASAKPISKRKIVLCVRPSSVEQKSKKRGRRSSTLHAAKSSTKRKLDSDNKENPPSKSIKTAFSNARSSPKSNNDQNRQQLQGARDNQATPTKSTNTFTPCRIKDILDHVDETVQNDATSEQENTPEKKG